MRKLFKYLLYFIYAIALFLLIVAYRFPYKELKGFVVHNIENNLALGVKIGDISYSFPFSIVVHKIHISNKNSSKEIVSLDDVKVTYNPINIFKDEQIIGYSITTPLKSKIVGSVNFDRGEKQLKEFNLFIIKLNIKELKRYVGRYLFMYDISGKPRGSFLFKGALFAKNNEGQFSIHLSGFNILIRIPMSRFKDLNNIVLDGKCTLKNNLLEFETLTLKQAYLHAWIKGSIKIVPKDIAKSRINLIINMKIDPSAVDKRLLPKNVINKIMRGKKVNLIVRGNLSSPSILFR